MNELKKLLGISETDSTDGIALAVNHMRNPEITKLVSDLVLGNTEGTREQILAALPKFFTDNAPPAPTPVVPTSKKSV